MVALRRVLPLAFAGLLALLLAPGFGVPDEPKAADKEDDKEGKEVKPLTLPGNKGVAAQLEAAADYIEAKEWVDALRVLQKRLSPEEDRLLPPPGKGVGTWTSARVEALRMLAGLPPEGRDFYQLTYGPKAADLLKAALKDNKPEQLALVARDYLYTDAGPKALAALAGRAAEAQHFGSAALYYGQLLRHRGVARWTPADLFQATLAFRRVGDRERADVTAGELLSRVGREGLRLGKTKYDREGLAKELARMGPPPVRDEWPIYGGNAARSDQGIGGPPFMDMRWKNATVGADETARFLKQAEKLLHDKKQPVLPAFYPVTAANTAGGKREPLLIFRSYWGIHAVDVKTGKLKWDSPSSWSLDRTLARGSDARKIQAMTNWLNYYINQNVRPQIVFENSVLGSLSTDGAHVYAVEDLAVPPSIGARNGFNPGYNPGLNYGAEVNDWIRHNRLQAFELATNAKLKWEIGGRGKGDLDDTFFLGPPLPLEGRLYVLTQKDKDLRLAVLDPRDGKLLALHKLATVSRPLSEDPIRRTQAAHLAYSQGTLVCPTNAGAVVGFDLLAGRIAWAYSYAETTDAPAAPPAGLRRRGAVPPGWVMLPDGRLVPLAGMNTGWKVTAPMIADGKVVFAAPDARSVHCLNLSDGTLAWSQKRTEDDLYLGGVYAGRVLIVGKKSARGLSLARGEPLWTLETGLPSGQGAASDNVYYLPLKEGARSKEPEVCAIDMRRGVIVAHTRSRQKNVVPGNLLFFEGNVVSQTATEVVAYPQLKVKLARMDELLRKDPADPVGLVERAELRLDKGDLTGAIGDLRKALAGKPAGNVRDRARALLYQALTEGLQRDFTAFEKYLAEYEALSKEGVEDKAEVQRRLANYYLLVGKGREAQGKPVEALRAYLELAAQGPGAELISLPDEPALRVRRDVWLQGRITELFKKATPEQRKRLEEEIGRRRKALRGGKDVEGLRAFVALFGADTAVGREARLELARLLIEKEGYAAADQLLQELRRQRADATLAARAVLELARMATRRGLLADAFHYYRILAKDFARTEVEGKKTGAELFEELQTDKRFLPFLQEAPAFPAGKLKATEQKGSFPYAQQVYRFPQEGEPLPFFLRNRLALHLGYHKLQLLDPASGEERWGTGLTRTMFQQMMYANGQPHQVRFPFQNVGHLVVLPVGHMVFGIDPVGRRVLWEKDVAGTGGGQQTPNGPQYQQIAADPRDGSLRVYYADGWVQRIGPLSALSPAVLCLQTRAGLQGIDPLTGQTLWSREDVQGNSDVFADGRTAYVVRMGADNRPIATRAFRLADGGEVRVPGFADAYRNRLHVVRHNILLADTDARDRARLRLYDVRAGKDVWERTYPSKSFVLQSAAPDLAGAAAPDGAVHVVDAASGKGLLKAKIKPEHLVKVDKVRLLADRDNVYVACVGPTDPNIAAFGGVRSNLMPGTGLRALPLNGEVYAFARRTGKLRWYAPMPDQMLVLARFEELPVLLFTSTYQKWVIDGAARHVQQVTAARAIEKRTGKPLFINDSLPAGMQFHTLKVDAAKGRIDLIGYQLKVSFAVAGADK